MIKARRIGHATLETPDIDRQIDYFTGIVGLVLAERQKDRAYLASKLGPLSVQLERAATPRLARMSFEVAADTDFAAAEKFLSSEGINSERRNDPNPGVRSLLSFKDPNGVAIDLFHEWTPLGLDQEARGAGVLKLGHIAQVVTDDPKKLADFYCKMLGFRVSDWIENWFVFLRCGPDHHTVNFLTGKRQQMHHIAFEVKDWAHMQQALDLLGKKRIPLTWGPGRHTAGHNIFAYHRNPDDQIVELFGEIDQMNEDLGYFEPRPWHRNHPQRPRVWNTKEDGVGIWGPPPTPDHIRQRE